WTIAAARARPRKRLAGSPANAPSAVARATRRRPERVRARAPTRRVRRLQVSEKAFVRRDMASTDTRGQQAGTLLVGMTMSSESGSGRLYLVDGSGYFFRAFHALPSLSTRSGTPTGAIYGFTNMLNKLLRESDASHVAVVLDAPGPTFRDVAFEQYKGTRTEMPSDLVPQLPYARRVVKALGQPLLEIAGVEADDVIATLAPRPAPQG